MKIHVVRERPKQKLHEEVSIGQPCIKCHRPITKEVVEYFQNKIKERSQRFYEKRMKGHK